MTARYTLSMPEEIMKEIRVRAKKNECNVTDVVRQCLRFGLIGMSIADDEDKKLLIDEGGKVKELYFVL